MRFRSIGLGLPLLFGLFSLPLLGPWQGYVLTETRLNLAWDAAAHFADGMKLYLDLRCLDPISFLIQFLSFGQWLPVHPVLVGISHVFFPFQVAPVVFLNYLLLVGALAVSVLMIARTTKFLEVSAAFAVTAASLRLLCSAPVFVSLLNNVMLELTAFALTWLFLVSAALALSCSKLAGDKHSSSFFRAANWFLFGLFMTKIHYGIVVFPVYLATLLVDASGRGLLPRFQEVTSFFKAVMKRPYVRLLASLCFIAVILLAIRLGSGVERLQFLGLKISISRFGNFLWFLLWVPLLIWTVEWWQGRSLLRGRFSPELRHLHDFCLFPFAWFYLFPFRHKIGTFLFMASYRNPLSPTTLRGKIAFYWLSLARDYLGLETPRGIALALVIAIGFALAIFLELKRSPVWRSCFAFLLGNFACFYLLMTFGNSNQESRMAISWVAELGVICVFTVVVFFQELRISTKLAETCGTVVLAGAGLLMLILPHRLSNPEAARQVTQAVYLPNNYRDLDFVFAHFDPAQPGVIWGMGMDLGNPLVTMRILPKVPHGASFLFRSRTVLNDFGNEGNRDPVRAVQEHFVLDSSRQFVLFRSGFEPTALAALVKDLMVAAHGELQVIRDGSDYVFLSRPLSGVPKRE